VVAEVRERLSVSKQAMHKHYVERFNLKKLNNVEVREQHQLTSTGLLKISERI
jgi:hypothetical protein